MSCFRTSLPGQGVAPHGVLLVAVALLLGACASDPHARAPAPDPDVARSRIAALLPSGLDNRAGWAVDIFAAFDALAVAPSVENICAVVAVTAQETGFRVDPAIPGLPAIARREMQRRAADHNVPKLLLDAALELRSPDGRSYSERLDAARTERQLSDLFEDFIAMVPMGRRLLSDLNPVRTAGPMQVSIEFAQQQVQRRRYPYGYAGTLREEVFSRRGGLYFGIAHLFDYPVDYDRMVYRFADFNAGHYASRNAAFQSAVSQVSRVPLELDGDLVLHGDAAAQASRTELAVRSLGPRIRLGDEQIHTELLQGEEESFTRSRVYMRVFELADARSPAAAPRAIVPVIRLKSPKITRQLTTDWFARRVDDRHRKCLARSLQLQQSRAAG